MTHFRLCYFEFYLEYKKKQTTASPKIEQPCRSNM